MSLVISMGFGVDIDAFYKLPFSATLDEIDELEATLTLSESLSGTLIGSDAICGTLISQDSLLGTLDDDDLSGTLECT